MQRHNRPAENFFHRKRLVWACIANLTRPTKGVETMDHNELNHVIFPLLEKSDDVKTRKELLKELDYMRSIVREEISNKITKEQAMAELKSKVGPKGVVVANRFARAFSKKHKITMCARCAKMRSKKGQWIRPEAFLRAFTAATFSHGYCPDCFKRIWAELKSPKRTKPNPASAPTPKKAG